MSRDIDPQIEASARQQLTRLIDAIETTPAEEVDIDLDVDKLTQLDRARARAAAARRRRSFILASATVAAAAAAVVAFVVVPNDDGGNGFSTENDSSTTTTTAPSSTTSTTAPAAPEATERVTPPLGTDTECGMAANDGVVESGTFPDGRTWEYRVSADVPEVLVDGTSVEVLPPADVQFVASYADGLAWDVVVDDGVIPFVAVPATATLLDLHVWNGTSREVVEVCTKAVDDLRYGATLLPAGSEVLAVVANDPARNPVAFSDYVSVREEGGPESMTEAVSGEITSDTPGPHNGPWRLATGGDSELVRLDLSLPTQGTTVRSTPELLRNRWFASSIYDGAQGRYFIWGYIRRGDVAEVHLTMYDGQEVSVPTVPSGISGDSGRVFAGEFSLGIGVRLVEGRTAEGTVVVELRNPEAGAIGNGMPEGGGQARIPMNESNAT
jgi:hypothetical protein